MLELVDWYFMSLMYNILGWYMYAKLTNNLIAKVSKKNVLLCLIISFLHFMSIMSSIQLFTILFKVTFTTILMKKLYNENLSKTLITTFLIYLICAIGEVLFVVIFIAIFHVNQTFIQTNLLGILIANVVILILSVLIMKIKFLRILFKSIINWCIKNSIISNIILVCLAIITVFLFIFYNYKKIESNELVLLINLFFVGVLFFVIGYFKERTDNS